MYTPFWSSRYVHFITPKGAIFRQYDQYFRTEKTLRQIKDIGLYLCGIQYLLLASMDVVITTEWSWTLWDLIMISNGLGKKKGHFSRTFNVPNAVRDIKK